MKNYTEIALTYAADVVDGTIPACKLTIQACNRAISDHTNENFDYYYDEEAAHRVCLFLEWLPHLKGPKANQRFVLSHWQCFILCQVFGWKCKTGYRKGQRRFRRVYIEVPRGQGKSTLSSGVGLYMVAADGEHGANVISCATNKEQAQIVFKDAQAMARHSITKPLMNKVGVDVMAHAIVVTSKYSNFVALSADSTSLDGLNISLAIVDELHAHKTRALYDVIETGAGKRPTSIIWCITTAGSDRTGICYEQRDYLLRILNQSITDESLFGCIWSCDEHDPWNDEATWKKANPDWGGAVDIDYVTNLARKAAVTPAAINNFKTKHLNVWVNSDSPWMSMTAWNAQRDESLKIQDFKDEKCFVGLDLATTTDIAAKLYVFPKMQEDGMHFYGFGSYYVPRTTIDTGTNAQYPGWEILGLLTVSDGNVNDFGLIEDEIVQDMRDYQTAEIAYDPWQSAQLSQRLINNGATMVEFRNTVANMSAPMKRIEELVLSGKFHHNDPILTWMVENVVCHTDLKDNIFPRKSRPEKKIDGVVALIFAMGRYMMTELAESVYNQRGLVVF